MATARISKIARRAGVSEATVSRVLNNKPNVSAATRQAVLASVDVLGMEAARSTVRSGRLIGLIIPELSNPIFPALAQVIEQALSGRGYTPVLCTQTAGGSTEDGLVEMLVGQGVAGIVFVSGLHANADADTGRYEKLAERRIPFILINGFNEKISAPFISPDDHAAMWMAVQHLVQLGHERIGLAVGQQRFVPVKRKVDGFSAALQQLLGRSAEESQKFIHHTLFTVEGGHAAGDVLLDRGCTAIVCGSDMMALGAVRAVRERGLSVPEHVSVVGFDGSAPGSRPCGRSRCRTITATRRAACAGGPPTTAGCRPPPQRSPPPTTPRPATPAAGRSPAGRASSRTSPRPALQTALT